MTVAHLAIEFLSRLFNPKFRGKEFFVLSFILLSFFFELLYDVIDILNVIFVFVILLQKFKGIGLSGIVSPSLSKNLLSHPKLL
jgi:hypothetical protein